MRLVSPALYYIKYLVCHPDAYSTSDIVARLRRERLDYISDAYIDGVRATLKPPKPFHPTDSRHAKSFSFINMEKINRIFHPDDSMRLARNILEVPRAKEFVESMLAVRVPLLNIAAYVTTHRAARCTAGALQAYQHYFWNLDLLDSSELRLVIALRFKQAGDDDPALKDMAKRIGGVYYKDPRKVAADLPYSPTTAMLTAMRQGIKPTRIDLAMRISDARDLAIIRALEAVQQDGPGDDQKFVNYVNGSKTLEEMLQLSAKPEDHMREQLKIIALRTETEKLPSIHQLSGGRHTAELAPVEDSHEGTRDVVAREGDFAGQGRDQGQQ